jgi:hypothetical protein
VEGRHTEQEEADSNFWSAAVLTPSLRVGIIGSLRITSRRTERRFIDRGWENGRVRWIVLHLRCAIRYCWRGRRLVILGIIVLRRIILDESAGRCNLGTPVLHDEPDDESSDYPESDKASHNTSSDGTSVRTPSPAIRAVRCVQRRERITSGTGGS